MAKRGTFGGSRFGGPGYGRAGFKRGFGRASFSRKADLGFEGGIAKDMMDFFKQMQSGKFGMPQAPAQQERIRRPRPEPVLGPITQLPGPGAIPYWDSPETTVDKPKVSQPTGTPKQKKVIFRPKLTRGAR